MHKKPRIAIYCTSSSTPLMQRAQTLSTQLALPLATGVENDVFPYDMVLAVEQSGLSLQQVSPSQKSCHSLYIDFINGPTGYRRIHGSVTSQPLARAVGVKPGFRPDVVDATAGLGQDGFILACMGCTVTFIERSDLMAVLLRDGLQRAAQQSDTREIINRITLHTGDALSRLTTLSPAPHTIYLDPMYPHKKKSALNKKEMRIIRALVGDDIDADHLLKTALQAAANRVVVKRPKSAPILADLPPSHAITMKNSRFDVYMVAHYL